MRKYIIVMALGFLFLSCEKKVGVYKAEVRVVNETGIPIQNATVKLTVPVIEQNTLVLSAITGIDGVAKFEISNKAYYDIKVWKSLWRGCDYVEFKKDEIVRKDVILRPWDDPYTGCLN